MHGVRETEQRNGEKNNTTEKRKKTTLQRKKNREESHSNFTPLTFEEEKSLQSKKLIIL